VERSSEWDMASSRIFLFTAWLPHRKLPATGITSLFQIQQLTKTFLRPLVYNELLLFCWHASANFPSIESLHPIDERIETTV